MIIDHRLIKIKKQSQYCYQFLSTNYLLLPPHISFLIFIHDIRSWSWIANPFPLICILLIGQHCSFIPLLFSFLLGSHLGVPLVDFSGFCWRILLIGCSNAIFLEYIRIFYRTQCIWSIHRNSHQSHHSNTQQC